MEWQPMETAPKDGNDILLYRSMPPTNYGRGFIKHPFVIAFWKNNFWNCANLSSCAYPIAWMPLPEPPKE